MTVRSGAHLFLKGLFYVTCEVLKYGYEKRNLRKRLRERDLREILFKSVA